MIAFLLTLAYAIGLLTLAAIGSVILIAATVAVFALMMYMALRAGALKVSRMRARYNRVMRG